MRVKILGCLNRWLASWLHRDFLLLLVPTSGSPRIIPHRFSPSICSPYWAIRV
jgi:hypothetical protein